MDVPQAAKLLRGFERVALAPGETRCVTIPVAVKDLAYYDPAAKACVVERMEYPVYVGPSSWQAELLATSFKVSE